MGRGKLQWILMLPALLSGCHNVTNECPMVSQWWYNEYPQKSFYDRNTTGIRHDPSTITSVGHK